jgi:O-antigen/teichoic acid export membrane protein
MQVNKKDLLWNYAASFLKVAANLILLPFILRMMPSETVGIWSVFLAINALTYLLDFGFAPAFTRNVTYVFSGVQKLLENGIENIQGTEFPVDYGLLKGIITAMKWFYLRLSAAMFILLSTAGTYYIHTLMIDYSGNSSEVYISWAILCIVNSYLIYTFYYDSLLLGRGLIKVSKQIMVVGQTIYLLVAAMLVMQGKSLIAIVTAQALSVLIMRLLSRRAFFTAGMRKSLSEKPAKPRSEIIRAISPNAIKIGLTSVGGFLVQRSSILIGSLFLPLSDIATFGITIQIVTVISGISLVYFSTYQPRISHLFVTRQNEEIRSIYISSQAILLITYLIAGSCLIILGEQAAEAIGSRTFLMSGIMTLVFLFISMLETNHSLAGSILLSKNEVPFFKASLFAGALTISLLLILLISTNLNMWALIIAPGLANVYNNWKWPSEVYKLLRIREVNISNTLKGMGQNTMRKINDQ